MRTINLKSTVFSEGPAALPLSRNACLTNTQDSVQSLLFLPHIALYLMLDVLFALVNFLRKLLNLYPQIFQSVSWSSLQGDMLHFIDADSDYVELSR